MPSFSFGAFSSYLKKYQITYLNLPLRLQTHILTMLLYVYKYLKMLDKQLWDRALLYIGQNMIQDFDGIIMEIFHANLWLFLVDLLKLKICNLHIGILEGSHQDQDMITVG